MGGAMPDIGAGGFQTIPRIPPIRPRMNPMMNPPPIIRLKIENSRTRTPAPTCIPGFDHSKIAPTSTTMPNTSPRAAIKIPNPGKNAKRIAPNAAIKAPFRRMNIAAINDRTNAAVGFSLVPLPSLYSATRIKGPL